MDVFARRSSGTLIALGVVALLFGLVAAFWPMGTALGLVILWGVYALVDGITALGLAFAGRGVPGRGLLFVIGLAGLVAGLLVIFRPFSGQVALAWLLGTWLVVRGIVEVVGAFGERTMRPRWMLLLGGLLWIVAGVVFVANPGIAALTVALWLAILAIAWGVLLLAAGISLRSAVNDAERRTRATV